MAEYMIPQNTMVMPYSSQQMKKGWGGTGGHKWNDVRKQKTKEN